MGILQQSHGISWDPTEQIGEPDSLEFDDDGRVANTVSIVGELKQRFPEQFTQTRLPSIDGGAGTQNGDSGLSKEALSRMNPDEIARLDWTVVKQALAS